MAKQNLKKKVYHNIKPIYNEESKILILGSFPSVKSREVNFYYAHPQNQFFKILSNVFNEEINDKNDFLYKHNIALWDVVKSCTIEGSNDSSIKNIEVNNIEDLIKKSNITTIFTTGKKAYNLYQKYLEKRIGIKAIYLPSSSPVYQKMSIAEKVEKYKIILKYL